MSQKKYGAVAGDVGVIGTVRFITRNPLGGACYFNPNITANGYANPVPFTAFDGVLDSALNFSVTPVPEWLYDGQWVTADILQGDHALYAANLQAL
jgi:hypothetical protein